MNNRSNFRAADLVATNLLVYLWYNPAVHIALAKMMF
jgi:hypothetical protein